MSNLIKKEVFTTEEKTTLANLKTTVGDSSSGLVKDVEDLKTNGVSQDNIKTAVDEYLTEHPAQSGATTEQVEKLNTAYEHSQSPHIQADDLTIYQTKNDETLTTTDKTISGSINEMNTIIKNINVGSNVTFGSPAINLLNYNNITQETINGVTGYFSEFIEFDVAKSYVTKMQWKSYYYFNADKEYKGTQQTTTPNSGDTYTIIPKGDTTWNTKYIKVYFGTSLPSKTSTMFIEEGTVPLLDYNLSYSNKSRWYGKKMIVLGDSISTERANLSDITYCTRVAQEFGFASATNYSISGKTILWHLDNLPNYTKDYDLVIVMIGSNDHGYNTPIGTVSDTTTDTIAGRYDVLINKLLENNIASQIVFITPIKRVGLGSDSTFNGEDGYYWKNGASIKEVADMCVAKCQQYSIPCLYAYYFIEPKNEAMRTNYFVRPTDGTHPNTYGHDKYISPRVVEFIRELTPFSFIDAGSTGGGTETVYTDIVISKTSTTITEGDNDTFTVELSAPPSGIQTVNISSDNPDVTVSPSSLSFDSGTYNSARTVTIDVTKDDDANDDTAIITLSSTNVDSKTISVTITDNDVAKTLSSISAVYTQGDTIVYNNSNLNDLKNNLVVTATYSDNSSTTITDYSLSGTLSVGTSTITVTYQNKITTFDVTVTEYVSNYELIHSYDFTNRDGEAITTDTIVQDSVGNANFTCNTVGNATFSNNGLTNPNTNSLFTTGEYNLTNDDSWTVFLKMSLTEGNRESNGSFGRKYTINTSSSKLGDVEIGLMNRDVYLKSFGFKIRVGSSDIVLGYILGGTDNNFCNKTFNNKIFTLRYDASSKTVYMYLDGVKQQIRQIINESGVTEDSTLYDSIEITDVPLKINNVDHFLSPEKNGVFHNIKIYKGEMSDDDISSIVSSF